MTNDHWMIGVNAAMICDEWYPDFYIGQVIDFAVVFCSPAARKHMHPRLDQTYLEPSDDDVICVDVVDELDYVINGQMVYAGDAGWVLDIGIRVAARSKATVPAQPTDWAKMGEFVHGRTFLLAEWAETGSLKRDPVAPSLVYTWRIDRIQMWDEQAGEYSDEQSTNAWMEVELGRNTSYQLTCTRLSAEPKRERVFDRNRILRKKLGIDV